MFLSRGFVGQSTAYQRARCESAERRDAVLRIVSQDENPRLHWIDNYAKSFASSSIFMDKALFKQMLWTAHGMKVLPLQQDMSWVAKAPSGWPPALPNLPNLLHRPTIDHLFSIISSFERLQFDASLSNAMSSETLYSVLRCLKRKKLI